MKASEKARLREKERERERQRLRNIQPEREIEERDRGERERGERGRASELGRPSSCSARLNACAHVAHIASI